MPAISITFKPARGPLAFAMALTFRIDAGQRKDGGPFDFRGDLAFPPPMTRSVDVGFLAPLLGRLWLKLFGWRVEGRLPEGGKAVVIAAPHTSNWDLPFMLAVSYVLGVRPAWLGKRELFRAPFGSFMRWLGGIAVDRGARSNLVQQAVEQFRDARRLFLVIPPSGTRKRATHWKSGFYHVARGAEVPILCTFLDYRRKIGGICAILVPSGDVAADMDVIRGCYAGVTGMYPALTTPVRLLEEEAAVPPYANGVDRTPTLAEPASPPS
jgi:1-acyl-sn-glycerol-3-phosphate acyltransferase